MSDEKSLIKIDDVFGISLPVTRLIEKISDAIGTCYEPRRIRNVAQAETDAALIREEGQIKINELQQRAMLRFISEEAKKQENIESIIHKAIPLIAEDSSKPDEMEDDWIVNIFDKCRIISDDDMQQLWSKILAGEANAPRTYSKRTVNLLSSLDKKDAELFTSLCSFIWDIGDGTTPLIYDFNAEIYDSQNLNFETYTHLMDIGLIHCDFNTGFSWTDSNSHLPASYFGTTINIEISEKSKDNKKNPYIMLIGHAMLTNSGIELARICNPKPVDGFLDYILENWKKQGLTAKIIKN